MFCPTYNFRCELCENWKQSKESKKKCENMNLYTEVPDKFKGSITDYYVNCCRNYKEKN